MTSDSSMRSPPRSLLSLTILRRVKAHIEAFSTRRRRRVAGVAIVLACVIPYLIGYFSIERRAIRRIEKLGGHVTGLMDLAWIPRDQWPDSLAWLLVRQPKSLKVNGIILQDGVLSESDLRIVIDAFPDCELLDLSGTNATDHELAILAGARRLSSLNLAHTSVTDAGLAQIGHLGTIQKLNLNATAITDAGLVHLARMPTLVDLCLAETQVTDAGIGQIAKAGRLERVDLRHTQVTDVAVEDLSRCNRLTVLILDETRITDASLLGLTELTRLRVLSVRGTTVTDGGLAQLHVATHIQGLSTGHSRVTPSGVAQFRLTVPDCVLNDRD